jgi:hypothetical protein
MAQFIPDTRNSQDQGDLVHDGLGRVSCQRPGSAPTLVSVVGSRRAGPPAPGWFAVSGSLRSRWARVGPSPWRTATRGSRCCCISGAVAMRPTSRRSTPTPPPCPAGSSPPAGSSCCRRASRTPCSHCLAERADPGVRSNSSVRHQGSPAREGVPVKHRLPRRSGVSGIQLCLGAMMLAPGAIATTTKSQDVGGWFKSGSVRLVRYRSTSTLTPVR